MHAKYTRLSADDRGQSRFEDVDVTLTPGMAVPPAEPLYTAPFQATEGAFWIGVPTAWKGDAHHPAPRRMVLVTVQGEYEITASGGAVRRFPVGSVLSIEDTSGEGHSTKIVSREDVIVFAAGLPSPHPG